MTIVEATITDKSVWDKFVKENNMGSFLQSWQWSEFVISLNEKGWRFFVKENEEIIGSCFLVKKHLRLKQSQFNCPRGPVLDQNLSAGKKQEVLSFMIDHIDNLAKQEKVLLFLCDPCTKKSEIQEVLLAQGFKKSKRNDQPQYTLMLDLTKDQEELLKQMHSKTRYNIRLAQKKGVKIIIDNTKVNDFYSMLKKTQDRQKVSFYSKKYFQELLKLDFVKLYLAVVGERVIAANIIIFWNGVATYLFGGTDNDYRQYMAPQLLQWQAILEAQKTGCEKYDFWGAAPENVTGHEKRWVGVTRFKKSFYPENKIIEYIGTYEKKYQPLKLFIYRTLQKILK